MRKINLLTLFTVLVLFIFKPIFSQEPNLRKIISDIERGEADKARILLMSLEKDNPNSASVKFLKAVLSEDGTEAAKFYRDVAFSGEENDFRDISLFKLYQYHYSRGEFNESDKYARMLRESFPKSEFVNYLRRENLTSARLQSLQKSEQKFLSDTSGIITQTPRIIQQPKEKFTIQVGAFSTESNAQKFAAQFAGYSTKIREKEVGGRKLFVVLVGSYLSEIDAKNEIQKLKNRFNVNGIVVSSE